MIRKYWGQSVIEMGDRWRMNIFKLHLQPNKQPVFSLNGKLLRAAQQARVVVEVAFPARYGYVVSKTPEEWLKGRRELRTSQFEDSDALDYYYHEVPENFPREGRKKELYQAVGQRELFR